MKKTARQQKTLNFHLISFLAIWVAIAAPWFDLSVSNHSFVKTYVAGIGIGILVLITLWKKHNETNTVYHLSLVKISWLFVLPVSSAEYYSGAPKLHEILHHESKLYP